jgi:hypothetical protein
VIARGSYYIYGYRCAGPLLCDELHAAFRYVVVVYEVIALALSVAVYGDAKPDTLQ